ncbi:MAG: hypothetical protein V3V08_11620 [Nannocystaceae bacterium]
MARDPTDDATTCGANCDSDPGFEPPAVADRLARLPDPAMREAVLAGILERLSPARAAWLLDTFATVGRAGGASFDLSLLAAVDLAGGERLDDEERARIYTAACEHRLEAAQELLYSEDVAPDRSAAIPRPLTPGTRPLTLGERKSLARSWRRDVLERLIVDPHADVVRLLLANPHVTEADILKIATARRSSGPVLNLIIQARRWSCRPRVRFALIRNPKLPLATALRLLGLLNRTELRELSQDPQLRGRLAEGITRRLKPLP